MTAQPSPTAAEHALHVLPGALFVIFLLRIGAAENALVYRPARFLEGLMAASAMLSFREMHRDEPRLEELLPWAGNV